MDIFKSEPGPALSQVFDLSPMATLVMEATSLKIVAINEATKKLLALNDLYADQLYLPDILIWQETVQQALAIQSLSVKGFLFDHFAELTDRDGKRLCVFLTFQPLRYQETDCFLVFIRDVSETTRLQTDSSALKEAARARDFPSEKRQWVFDCQTQTFQFTTACLDFFDAADEASNLKAGLSAQEIASSFAHPSDKLKWETFVQQCSSPRDVKRETASDTKRECLIRLRRKSGVYLWYEFKEIGKPESDRPGQDTSQAVYGTLNDVHITKQEAIERYISLEQLEIATTEAKVGVWQINTDGTTIWNHINYQIFGYEPPCLLSNREIFFKSITPETSKRLVDWYGQLFSSGEVSSIEFDITTPQGDKRRVRSYGKRCENPVSGNVYGLGISQDITQEWRMTEQLITTQAELRQLTQKQLESARVLRQKLAIDLHDCLSQTVTMMRWSLDKVLAQIKKAFAGNNPFESDWRELEALFTEILQQLRSTLKELNPPYLSSMGLALALEQECKQINARGLPMHAQFALGALNATEPTGLASQEPQRYPAHVEHALYLIAREALTNAIKHAGGDTVALSMACAPGAVEIAIADNGCGIRAESQLGGPAGHLGLVGMREHANAIGAQFELGAQPAGGTRVLVKWQG